MKKKIMLLAMAVVMLTGCGSSEYVRDLTQDLTSDGSESSDEVDITSEGDAADDSTASADDTDSAASETEGTSDETANEEESDGDGSEDAADADIPDPDNPVLTAESAELFRNYLLDNIEDDYFAGDECPLYECTFALCDVNSDGYEDLLISGYIGVRVAADSLVVFDNNGELQVDVFSGIIERCNENHLYVNACDYGGAGEEFYTDYAIYSYEKDFTRDYDGRYELGEIYYDTETGEEYDPPKQSYERYTAGIDAWEITPEEYNGKLEEYGLDEDHVLMSYSLNVDDVNMYVQPTEE